MVGETANGGRSWRDRHDDGRDDRQRLADRAGVRRQVVGLGRAPRQDAYRRVLLSAVQARRAARDDRRRFVVVKPQHGLEVGVVRGELLLRADATKDAALLTALAPYGFTVTPIAELDGRVLRLSDPEPELSVDELTDVARFVRTLGHQASVNHITPLGPVMKGQGGPENTAVELPAPTAAGQVARRVPVAVIDTGVTREQRSDGWLRGLVRDDNVDPLDDLPEAERLSSTSAPGTAPSRRGSSSRCTLEPTSGSTGPSTPTVWAARPTSPARWCEPSTTAPRS